MSFDGNLQPTADSGYDLANKGSIHTHDSSANTGLTVSGNNGYVLSENSSTSTGLEWIASASGGIEESFTVTASGTSTPTSQTGMKGIIIDMRETTAGEITVNVDGSSYLVCEAGSAYALAVNPSSSLNFVAGGAGRQLTTASYVQSSNEASTASNPIGLWIDPSGIMTYHCAGVSSGLAYGGENMSSAWDITTFGGSLTSQSSNVTSASRATGFAGRYTGADPLVDLAGYPPATTNGGLYLNYNQTGGTWGDGISSIYSYPSYWGLSGTTSPSTDEATLTSIDTDVYGMATNRNQSKWFVTGRQNDSVYMFETAAGMSNGLAMYIEDASGTGNAVTKGSKNISAQLTDMVDLSFSDDGLWMVVAGASGNLYSYILTVAYDLSTATYDQTYSTSAQSTSIGGVQINYTGTRVFVLDSTANPNYIFEYNTEGAVSGTARIVIIGA